jgi:hypothetical protein
MDDQHRERLLQGALDIHRGQPARGDPAGGRLALADLVAIEHQHLGADAAQLARDGEPREARPADEHVAVTLQRGALRAPLGRARGHLLSMIRGSRYPPVN